PTVVAEFIKKVLNVSDEQLAHVLASVESWKWPRSDLNAWTKVLNKFDSILEDVINQYELDKVQLINFPSQTKALVSEILRFQRLLLENSTNRKTFSSYDRLNSLLLCSDLDIVLLSLNVLLRPAQQYSAQSSVSHILSFTTPRLLALAKRWPFLREYGINLIDLVSSKSKAEVEGLPADTREVSFSFYKTDAGVRSSQEKKKEENELLATPSKSQGAHTASSSGPVNVLISEATLSSESPMKILADSVRTYEIPDEEKFELLNRIRVSQALFKDHESEREKLVIARLLSIAIYAHTHTESQATTSFFLYEPDLIANVAELLQVDPVQTAAIAVLDAFTRYRNRCQEVLTAVNAGVNHGILMALFRKTVNEVANPSSDIPQSCVEALLQFVTLIATHTSGVNMIVGAGLIPLLVQLVDSKLPNRLVIVSKTLQLIDSVLYSFQNGFSLFCAAHGVNVLVERIEYEVDSDIQEHGRWSKSLDISSTGNDLPIPRSSVLKHLLRTMHRMMQSSGTSEGLRGLIDTSLVKSIRKIIDNRVLFGPAVLPLAINIMATFVHNEPTSLGIIQEAGLPEAFYKAIEAGIEPAIEVIQSIPNALGALCLNEAGQIQLSNRPSIIPAIFAIFTSERHLKVLIDKENAVIIGTAIDELVRHHPLLKAAVFTALKSILSTIEEIGKSYQVQDDLLHWYQLVPTASDSSDGDVKMEDARPVSTQSTETEMVDISVGEALNSTEEAVLKSHDNTVVSFIDVLCRFLEGFFQHAPHCSDFITLSDGLRFIGRLTNLPCLPYDFSNSVASDSLVQVMRTLVDSATNETLLYLAEIVRESLQDTRAFWDVSQTSSELLPLLELNAANREDHNSNFRSLVTLHIRTALLSDVFGTIGYSHGRGAFALLQTLMGSCGSRTIPELGALHRATIWENIVLNAALSKKGIPQSSPSQSPLGASPNLSTTNLVEAADALNTGASTANGIQSGGDTEPSGVESTNSKQDESPITRNAAALKYLTHGIPNVLAPFFQSIVKMFHARRSLEASQKKQIQESASTVAKVLLSHLQIQKFDDVPSVYTYYSVIFGLYTLLFVDERTSTNTLHTVEVHAFYQIGGFDEVLRVCTTLTKSIEEITEVREEDRSDFFNKTLIHAYGGLKVALHLLHPIISAKPLFESPQTLLLITRDKKETDLGFFDPNSFLVRLRFKVTPLLRSLWEAPWLVQAPLGVSRSIVRSVLELVHGENEQSKPETTTESAVPNITRPTGPDENRVQTLVDMGFPRHAAERALVQTRNNVTAATDFLLSHPFAFPEPAQPQPPATQSNDTAGEPTPEENAEQTAETPGGTPMASHAEAGLSQPEEDSTEEVKTIEEWKRALDEARTPLQGLISRQALLLVDEHQSLLFELRAAFVWASPNQSQAVRDLVDDVKSFSPYAYDVQEQPLANRCRLLALVFCENPSSLNEGLRKELLDSLLALLLSGIDPENPPKWLASHLLVTEALLILAEEPCTITLPKEDEPINSQPLSIGLHRSDAKDIIPEFCLRLLAVRDLASDEFLSVLRLLVHFSKDKKTVKQLLEGNGLTHLFKRLAASEITGGSSYVITILRHIVEDRVTIRNIMSESVKRYFQHPRNNTVDVNTYVRTCNAMAFRDSGVFLDVTQSLCSLSHPFGFNPQIALKVSESGEDKATPGEKDVTQEEKKEEGVDMEMRVDQPAVVPVANDSYAENVIHHLFTELMTTIKSIHETPTSSSAQVPDASRVESNTSTQTPGNTNDKYQYACFLMQCLTELLFSYDTCKLAFLSFYPKKKAQTPAKESTSKFRSMTLQFLFNDIINPGTINPSPSDSNRQHLSLCNWAMLMIVSICVDTSTSPHEPKDISPELVAVRKFVLETLSRSLKDVSTVENIQVRYGKLLAYADLCHRLLTVRFNNTTTSGRKQQDEIPTHLAKIMLEKNYVSTLTNALTEVDLNYPHIRTLVDFILRPLQYLTKIAIKMSRGSKNKDSPDTKRDDSESSSLSPEEDEASNMSEDETREETPDLYRNSALGMYGGEMDDGHYSGSDEMDEDEEDEGDVEMEFDGTGSEDTSEATEEEEEDELGEDEDEAEEDWHTAGAERQEDQDLVENTEDDEDDEDDEDVIDDEVDEEVDEDGNLLWESFEYLAHFEAQDVPPPGGGLGPIGEDIDDEDDHGVPIQIIHHEEDLDMASDDEGFRFEGEVFGAEAGLPFTAPFINIAAGRDPPPVFLSRRSRSDNEDIQVFGRTRNAPAPPPETITHPLLLDTTTNSTRLPPNVRRGARYNHRNVAVGADLFQNLDEIMGPGSTQFLQHILTAGGAHAFQLDVGNMMNLDRGHRRPTHGVISAAIRVERGPGPRAQSPRQGREFDPLLTLQRWAEEAKILNGDFVSERSGKLVNHVILALLPAAAEARKKAKAAEEAAERDAAREREEERLRQEAETKQEEERARAVAATTPAPDATVATDVERTSDASAAPTSVDEPAIEDQAMEVVTPDQDTPMDDVTAAEGRGATPAEDGNAGASTSSQPPQRITVLIHGSAVDITDTGIDPTFLEALPDDMREEVLNEHVRDQRAATIERPADSQISTEFLDALPPEIRAEIIQQEAMDRARQRAEESASAQPGQPADIDPASFIASLDPTLRQTVLMEQNEGFLQTLPPHILAEAGGLADGQRRAAHRTTARSTGVPPAAPRKFTIDHDAIQLLERSGIAALVRLLFFPQVSKKNLLFKVLVNVCENAKTRAELFNILLRILQDGPADLAAVDKSFSQLTVRGTSKPQTPKSVGKQKASDYFTTLMTSPSTRTEAVPDLVVQRCLESLTYIVSSNELASLFFMTEHELPAGLRKVSGKKGKGKEKQAPQTHYPIVLLLGLLDRRSLIRTPAIMESLVGLLATVTKPLASLKPKEADVLPPNSTITDATPQTIPATSSGASTTEGEGQASSNIQPAPNQTTATATLTKDSKPTLEALEEKILLANPPQVPHAVLRLIVNILTVGECSGRTFQQSLALIQHLSYIPDARDVIAQELRSKAEEFGHALHADLNELVTALQGSQDSLNAVAAKFSPASSLQAKLLRVLKTIDYMYSSKAPSLNTTTEADIDRVQTIYESFRFTPLWQRLGDCLSIIEDKPDTEHIAIVLLPMIEALMVVCKYVGSRTPSAIPRALRGSMSPRTPTTPRESMEDLFISFTDAHRKVLNVMVRNNPSLMSGSFALLINNPRVLDFDNKRNYFNQQLHRRPATREHYGTLQLNVRRARVFEDSFQYLQRKTGEQIKYGKLSVRFYAEEGVDAGGVTREWFQILARQMFDPNNALFQPCAADKLTYQPNKNSWVHSDHLSFFKFVGRVIGKAIYDGRLLDAYFAKSLYRQILGKPVDYRDVEWVDPEYYNSLCWILENDPTVLELNFSVEADEFGVNRIVPLKENGEAIPVTQENKREFVQLSAQYRLYSSIKDQIENLLNGFYEIIPKDLITIFNEQELELLISGTPDIDVDEWRAATEYNGYSSSDPNIVWWWRALKSFNREERAKVLSFATGTSRVPLNGFVDLQGVQGVQRFSIHRAYGEPDRLPQAHTCFNQIDLPQYSSYEMLRQQLLLAINEGGEGFAFS
ncbi:E3 ubiquitin-protein ligase ptr1, partial [Leucoagaricus sp. SymC.cos]